jgi:amidase
MEPGILDLCERALGDLAAVGCEAVDYRVPFAGDRLWRIWLAHRHLMVGGQFHALVQNPETRKLVKPALIWEVEGLDGMTARQVYQATEERSAWYQAVLRMFGEVDYLAVPSAQVFPFDAKLDWPRQIAGRPMDTYHRWMETVTPWTLAGCPDQRAGGFQCRRAAHGHAIDRPAPGRPGRAAAGARLWAGARLGGTPSARRPVAAGRLARPVSAPHCGAKNSRPLREGFAFFRRNGP